MTKIYCGIENVDKIIKVLKSYASEFDNCISSIDFTDVAIDILAKLFPKKARISHKFTMEDVESWVEYSNDEE